MQHCTKDVAPIFLAPMFQPLSFVAMHRHDQAVMDHHPGFRLSLDYEDHSPNEEMDPQYGDPTPY
jgi:hypothetical protein